MKSELVVTKDDTRWINSYGELHREDGPAIIDLNGNKYWFLHGIKRRAEYISGGRAWYLGEELHRIDGPAFVWANGDEGWYRNGLRHRSNGPAVSTRFKGKTHYEWWLNGKKVTINDVLDEKQVTWWIMNDHGS